MQSIRLLQLLSRDLGQMLIIVECYYVSIYFFLCFILLQESPIQLLAEELLTTCSLTMVLIETSGYFQVDLK